MSQSIHDLLHRDWNQRPSASTVCLIFLGYSQFLDLGIAQTLVYAESFPSYSEWKSLVVCHSHEPQLLLHLANAYQEKGESGAARAIRQSLPHDDDGQTLETTLNEFGVLDSLTSYADKGDRLAGVRMCEAAVEEQPMNFWLWHKLCQLHIAGKDFDSAIMACNQANTKFPINPSPVLALCGVYSTKGDYRQAIELYKEFFDRREESTIWDNLLSSNGRLITLNAPNSDATAISEHQ